MATDQWTGMSVGDDSSAAAAGDGIDSVRAAVRTTRPRQCSMVRRARSADRGPSATIVRRGTTIARSAGRVRNDRIDRIDRIELKRRDRAS